MEVQSLFPRSKVVTVEKAVTVMEKVKTINSICPANIAWVEFIIGNDTRSCVDLAMFV
jgi:hypothetical protein